MTKESSGQPIYRLPPNELVPLQVVLAESLAESRDWGHGPLALEECHTLTRGEGVRVAVLDTGVDRSHPDFSNRIEATQDFTGSRSGVNDLQGHGTHCAGVIAANNDGSGMVGVAPTSMLLIGKVLGDDGSGKSAGIAAGIRWAVQQGAHVISMSLGGPVKDGATSAAIAEAVARGVYVVCAFGNEGPDSNTGGWPGKDVNVFGVAAVDSELRVAQFSSRGAELDFAAPGANVRSCYPGGRYATMSGTCIASGSYIYGPSGPKTIENIRAGDVVFAFKDGTIVERVVYGNHYRGRAETFQLRAAGRDVNATASHQMLVVDTKSRDIDWVRLGELKDRHRLLLPREMPNQVNPYLDATLDEEWCWLLGFFLGDGWVTHTQNGSRMNFAIGDDEELYSRVSDVYERKVGKPLKIAQNGGWSYDDSTRTAAILTALNLNYPCHEKTIPLWLWSLPERKQLAFYRGYRDADGHEIHAKGYRAKTDGYECASPDLIRRMAVFADYKGWQHTTYSSRTRKSKAPNSKKDCWTTSHVLRVAQQKQHGGWCALRRHKTKGSAIARQMGIDTDRLFAASHSIRDVGRTVDVYDLSVPDADCFVTQGIVTHNSMATPYVAGCIALILSYMKRQGVKWPTPAEMYRLLRTTARDLDAPGFDNNTGWGLVQPLAALKQFQPQPPAPPPAPTPPPASEYTVILAINKATGVARVVSTSMGGEVVPIIARCGRGQKTHSMREEGV